MLVLITKGDLIAQEMKIAQSGLAELFDGIEIVSEKDEPTYAKIFKRYGLTPNEVVMVGNSLKSDILPPLTLGAHAVHIPYQTDWLHEVPETSKIEGKVFSVLSSMETLPEVIAKL